MYFWKIDALAEDLKEGRVSQRQKMHYYLATSLLVVSLMPIVSTHGGETPNIFWALDMVISIMFTVGGILLCYEANSQGDDREFLDRIVCLGWPITLRMLAIVFAAYAVYAIIKPSGLGSDTSAFDILVTIGSELYIYKTLLNKITNIAGTVSSVTA